MTIKISNNTVRAIFILVIFFTVLLSSFFSEAQTHRKGNAQRYYGFEASFGAQSYVIKSDVSQIKDLAVVQEGGRAGIIAGTAVMKGRVELGYYYSAGSIPHTFDRFESSASIVFNPLPLILNGAVRWEPYLMAGIVHHSNKLYGHYLQQDGERINYSTGEQPFVGKISQESAIAGLGLEYKILNHNNFLHLFTEARYGVALSHRTKQEALAQTDTENHLMLSLGIRFGASR